MEKTIRIFKSHREADAANVAYYRSLTPEQRMRILFQIIADHEGEACYNERIKKVCRIVPLWSA